MNIVYDRLETNPNQIFPLHATILYYPRPDDRNYEYILMNTSIQIYWKNLKWKYPLLGLHILSGKKICYKTNECLLIPIYFKTISNYLNCLGHHELNVNEEIHLQILYEKFDHSFLGKFSLEISEYSESQVVSAINYTTCNVFVNVSTIFNDFSMDKKKYIDLSGIIGSFGIIVCLDKNFIENFSCIISHFYFGGQLKSATTIDWKSISKTVLSNNYVFLYIPLCEAIKTFEKLVQISHSTEKCKAYQQSIIEENNNFSNIDIYGVSANYTKIFVCHFTKFVKILV